MRTYLLFACALSLHFTTAAAAAQTPKRIALLISNQAYAADVGLLKNPHNDVALVGAALGQVGFELGTPLRDASREQILLAVYDFADRLKAAGPGAVGFLYYSGHGAAIAGDNVIVPVTVRNVSARELQIAGIKLADISSVLNERAPQAVHFVVFDACRNNLGGARGGKGFVPTAERPGMLVAFSTAPGTTASDEGQESGPYAAALAAELVAPGRNHDDMFFEIRRRVAETTRQEQIPWTQDGLLKQIHFKSDKDTAGPAPLDEAAQVWAVTKETTNTLLLEAFIARYKDTFHAELARGRLRQIEATRIETKAPVGIRIWGFVNMDAKCRPNLDIPIDILSKPRFGTISLRVEESTITTVSNSDRSHCIGTRQSTRTVYYVINDMDRERTGTDTVVIRVVHSAATYVNEFEVDLGRRTAKRTKVTKQ